MCQHSRVVPALLPEPGRLPLVIEDKRLIVDGTVRVEQVLRELSKLVNGIRWRRGGRPTNGKDLESQTLL